VQNKKDAQWWILEAQQHPERAADLIRILAERIAFLDRQNEELRGELIALRRKGSSSDSTQVQELQDQVSALESTLKQVGSVRQILAYSKGQILVNGSLDSAIQTGLPAWATASVTGAVVTVATARLLAISSESRAFLIKRSDLPVPEESAVPVENPRDIVTYLDQSVFDECRYLVLVSQSGYVYSILAGVAMRAAQRQENLLRNLIPGAPIVAAIPSNNADVFAISRQGRWLRFPENAIAGSGSRVMELPKNDSVAGLTWLSDAHAYLFFVAADGRLFARETRDLPAKRAIGRSAGVLLTNVEVVAVGRGTDLIAITRHGKVIHQPLKQVNGRALTATGLQLSGTTPDDPIATTAFF
jgi:DNA gyrase/topoisomerase IV subunit A